MAALNTARVLWFALLASTVLFLVVLVVLEPQPVEPPDPLLLPGFALTAIVVAVASFVMPAIGRKAGVQRFQVPTREEQVADPTQPESDILPAYRARTMTTRRVPVDVQSARARAAALFMTPFILSLSLSEAIALFGFVTGFLGFPLAYALPFFVVSWILILARFPTWDRMLGPIEQTKNIHIPRP